MRRTNLKWLEGAPSQVYDCLDMGEKYADRYTVILGDEVEYMGSRWVSVLNSSASLHVSIWDEMPTYKVAEYRRRFGHRRIAWSSLPEKVREVVLHDLTLDN